MIAKIKLCISKYNRKWIKRESLYSTLSKETLNKFDTMQLLSLMRHESHRIEKAIYNDIFQKKISIYQEKYLRINIILDILKNRNYPQNDPCVEWCNKIQSSFNDLKSDFIIPNSAQPEQYDTRKADSLLNLFSSRRSIRVWANNQPNEEELYEFGLKLIDAARWAPNSGNRQTWRFRIILEKKEKELFSKIKERHCVESPMLIFIGMDKRLYGAFGDNNECLLLDAGAAIMQMVLLAHNSGLGVCWNHFAKEFINTRKINTDIYEIICEKIGIPDHIYPVAILSIGIPKYLPPVPSRMNIEQLLL